MARHPSETKALKKPKDITAKITNMTNGNDFVYPVSGESLTKREYFAAMALQGMLANNEASRFNDNQIAIHAVMIADALIQALND